MTHLEYVIKLLEGIPHGTREYWKQKARYYKIIMINAGLHKIAPCVICGYKGPNYHQPKTHECMDMKYLNVQQTKDLENG